MLQEYHVYTWDHNFMTHDTFLGRTAGIYK